MSEIINVQNVNGQILVSSREIAENFEKQHKHVIEKVESIKAENSAVNKMFIESNYVAGTGKSYKEYLMNRDGFSLLVMGFTGQKALGWKLKYIEAFNKMEDQLKGQYQNLSTEMKALLMHDEKIQEIGNKVEKVDKKFDDLPLFPTDSKILKKLVNQTVVPLLGGKKSQAYKELSRKVFSDLYKQIHREFGVLGCEEIKRKDLEIAKEVISNYKLPRALEIEINTINSQVAFA